MSERHLEFRERAEVAFAGFTLFLALLVGYEVIRVSARLRILLGPNPPASMFQIFLLGDCLAATSALGALLDRGAGGTGRRAARRLMLFLAVAVLVAILRVLLWLPRAGQGM